MSEVSTVYILSLIQGVVTYYNKRWVAHIYININKDLSHCPRFCVPFGDTSPIVLFYMCWLKFGWRTFYPFHEWWGGCHYQKGCKKVHKIWKYFYEFSVKFQRVNSFSDIRTCRR